MVFLAGARPRRIVGLTVFRYNDAGSIEIVFATERASAMIKEPGKCERLCCR